MLLDELKKASIQAMKDKDIISRGVLSITISKCQLQQVEMKAAGKEFTDTNALEIIQKVLKELSDEKDGYTKINRIDKVDEVVHQIEVIKAYLPKQLTEDEIRLEISTLEDKTLPNIMKHFKTNFAGKVDMSLVSQIARSL